MNVMNQMLYVMTGMDPAFTPQAQPQAAQETEPNKFETVMREKHQEATGRTEQKEQKEDPELKTENEPAAEDQEIPAEQYVLAAAMLMQPRPEITYVEPEQTVVEQQPVEAAAEVEVFTAAPEQTVRTENVETVPTAENVPVEKAAEAPVAREAVELPTERKAAPDRQVPKAEQPEVEAERPVEQPAQIRETAERPQLEQQPEERSEEPEVELEIKPQTREVQEDEEESPDEVKGMWSEPVFKQVEAVPVKVAAPEKPVKLEAPEAPQQLGKKLADAIAEGREQLQIRLSPEGLGEVHVTITRLETGALSIVMRAADPRAASLLQQHTNGMQNAVGSAVRGEVQIEVREPQNSQQQQLLNPDGENDRQRQEQRQQRQEEQKQENEDFMQKLRLGLTDLMQAV